MFTPGLSFSANRQRSELPSAPSLRTKLDNSRTKYDLEWWFKLKGESFKDELANQKTQTQLSAYLELTSHLSSFLDLKVNPRLSLRSGYSQADNPQEAKANAIELLEASANFFPQSWVQFSAGALHQQKDISQVLMGDRAFPAARLTLISGLEKESHLALVGEAAVPTSSSLTNNLKEQESTPSFAYSGLKAQYSEKDFQLNAHAILFKFSNLPQSVAADSILIGNSADPQSSEQSPEFQYEFQGQQVGAEIDLFRQNTLGIQFNADWVKNENAPNEKNQGYLVQSKLPIRFLDSQLTPEFSYFRIEPDATVAYYNAVELQTNRIGYVAAISYDYEKLFSVKAGFGERDAIFIKDSISRDQIYFIHLESAHELF